MKLTIATQEIYTPKGVRADMVDGDALTVSFIDRKGNLQVLRVVNSSDRLFLIADHVGPHIVVSVKP